MYTRFFIRTGNRSMNSRRRVHWGPRTQARRPAEPTQLVAAPDVLGGRRVISVVAQQNLRRRSKENSWAPLRAHARRTRGFRAALDSKDHFIDRIAAVK